MLVCKGNNAACPLNVLRLVKPADVVLKPYPHLIKEGALPLWVYTMLEKAYPSDETVMRVMRHPEKPLKFQNNFRYDMNTKQIFNAPPNSVNPLWLAFVRFHTSPTFYQEVIRVFGHAIRLHRPDVEASFNMTLESLKRKIRFQDDPTAQIDMDCQVGINSPVTKISTVRGLHYDIPTEVWAGLLYMRQARDTARGGHFRVYDCPAPCTKSMYKQKVHPSVKLVSEVPYKRNVLAMFINSYTSIHAVSPRSVTPYSRRLVNMIGQKVRRLVAHAAV